MITWIDRRLALAIHDRQLAEHGGGSGVRDAALLDSALARPQQRYAYGDPPPDLADLAASLAYGLARNHPFVDGNKRTAAVACEVFIMLNDATLEADDLGSLSPRISAWPMAPSKNPPSPTGYALASSLRMAAMYRSSAPLTGAESRSRLPGPVEQRFQCSLRTPQSEYSWRRTGSRGNSRRIRAAEALQHERHDIPGLHLCRHAPTVVGLSYKGHRIVARCRRQSSTAPLHPLPSLQPASCRVRGFHCFAPRKNKCPRSRPVP
jgi:death-on-curing family protein